MKFLCKRKNNQTNIRWSFPSYSTSKGPKLKEQLRRVTFWEIIWAFCPRKLVFPSLFYQPIIEFLISVCWQKKWNLINLRESHWAYTWSRGGGWGLGCFYDFLRQGDWVLSLLHILKIELLATFQMRLGWHQRAVLQGQRIWRAKESYLHIRGATPHSLPLTSRASSLGHRHASSSLQRMDKH